MVERVWGWPGLAWHFDVCCSFSSGTVPGSVILSLAWWFLRRVVLNDLNAIFGNRVWHCDPE